ncbi:phosphoglucosamine mutase, partial [Candidatus Bathyarchaeota archaeon]
MRGLTDAVIFSSSGIRGVFNKTFTLEDAVKISVSFAELIGEGKIVVGRDTRPSGKPIAEAVIAGLTSMGRDVVDVEVAPTPTILHAIRDLKAAGGIVVSASHNPPEWNALKLAGPDGLLLGEEYYTRIKNKIYAEAISGGRPRYIGSLRLWNPLPSYFKSILGYIDRESIKLNPVKVAVDCGGGAGALATPILLRELGCEVKTIHCHTCGFFPRPLEPNQETLGDLSRFVVSTGSDVGVAHDCDADRIVCVNEDGEVLRPDEGFALIVEGVLREKPEGLVVTNVATSLLVEAVAERYGAKVVRVAVGEANVVREMVRCKATVGGEGSSGGVILPAVHYVRDGPLA